MIHADFPLLIAYLIGHIVAEHFIGFVIHRFAALLGGGVGIVVLHRALDLVTGIAAAQRTYHRRYTTSATAAKLVANHPARHRAQHRTGDAVFILYRTTMSHRDIAAFLTRRFHGFFNRCTGDHLRILRAAIQHVETSDSCNAQRGSHAYPYTRQHRFIHGLDFRKEVQRLREESDGWFFDIWQPEAVDKAECWPVAPGEDWHGFKDADADHMYLDPVKVTILTPGMDEQGNMDEEGIPAALVAKFLDERGVVVEKTGPYNLLFLFSIGIDKTRAMGLLRGLTEFKRAYDLNLRVKNMLPDLYAEDPDFYRNMRIQDLAQGSHRLIRQHQLPQLMLSAFDVLPEMKMTPHHAWQRQIKGEVETIELENLVGRISANMILPYPPGVPLLMPGEMITEESRAVLDFLLMLCSIGRHYPGFETDIHGAKRDEDGVYRVRVLKNDERLAR